jgi:hypothetical protein
LLGNYINPDDIERSIKDTGYFDFTSYRIEAHKEQVFEFFREHALLKKSPHSLAKLDALTIDGERLSFSILKSTRTLHQPFQTSYEDH